MRQLLFGAAVARAAHHDDVGEAAFGEVRPEPLGVARVVGLLRPGHRGHVGVVELQRVGERRGQQVSGVGRADHQPRRGRGVGDFGDLVLAPLDAEQSLVEHPVTLVVLGHPGAHPQTLDGEQHRAVVVEQIDIGLDRRTVERGDPGQAVARIAGRAVHPQAVARPAAAAARRCRRPARPDGPRPTGSRRPAAPDGRRRRSAGCGSSWAGRSRPARCRRSRRRRSRRPAR